MQITTAMILVIFSLDERHIFFLSLVSIESIKPFGIEYMLSPCCIFDGVLFLLVSLYSVWKNMVFDKTRTYSLTHIWFIKIHTYIHTYIRTQNIVSLMRRKHEVNIIWIDSTYTTFPYYISLVQCAPFSRDNIICIVKYVGVWGHQNKVKKLICLPQ